MRNKKESKKKERWDKQTTTDRKKEKEKKGKRKEKRKKGKLKQRISPLPDIFVASFSSPVLRLPHWWRVCYTLSSPMTCDLPHFRWWKRRPYRHGLPVLSWSWRSPGCDVPRRRPWILHGALRKQESNPSGFPARTWGWAGIHWSRGCTDPDQ